MGFLDKKTTHLVGIKGVGMTALAEVLHSLGYNVQGSDTPDSFFIDPDTGKRFRRLGIKVFNNFSPKNLPKEDCVIISSTAFFNKLQITKQINSEIKAAFSKNIPVFTYPEALGWLTKQFYTIGIAGTHGKSTTTAMAGWLFKKLGLEPTVILGTTSLNWKSNALAQKAQSSKLKAQSLGNRILIIEADEYREAFLNYDLKGLIITSIEYDHTDYFKTFGKYKNAFVKLVQKIPPEGFIAACGDNKNVLDAIKKSKTKNVFTYGLKKHNDIKIRDLKIKGVKQSFAVDAPWFIHCSIKLSLNFPLKPYALNAAAVLGMIFGFEKSFWQTLAGRGPQKTSELRKKIKIVQSFKTFKGTKRRFEIHNLNHKPIIIDDYAHHPTAVRALLEAVKTAWPSKKILIIFEPHTFSRTAAFKHEFAKSFDLANEIIIFKTYGSARETSGEFDSQDLVRLIQKRRPASYAPDYKTAREQISEKIKSNPVDWIIVTAGAGEIWRLTSLISF